LEVLFGLRDESPEEDVQLCSVFLAGYNATIYDYGGDKEERIQTVLNRACKILDILPALAVKCQLLQWKAGMAGS
jgi:hypothetical protein